MRSLLGRAAFTVGVALLAFPAAASADGGGRHRDDCSANPIRVATFNASLNRNVEGQLIADLSTADNAQAGAVAEVIQRARPDALLINEFDYDAQGTAARLFQDNYLVGRAQRRRSDPLPLPLLRALEHRHPVGPGAR